MKTIKGRAHGRVNLMGEHTDYNGGWVLPTTIPQFTEVEIEKDDDNKVTIYTSKDPNNHNERVFSYFLKQEKYTGTWADYFQGTTKILNSILKTKNAELGGFKAHVFSTIPEGSGLASSAALEMSFLSALKNLFQFEINNIELAKIGQRAENEFVGARVGIMDQMAALLGKEGEALFIDTLNLKFERIPLPLDEIDLFIINSGISHRLSSSNNGYNQRRSECEEACKLLGISHLREISEELIAKNPLPELLKKRVRHVMTENKRVFDAVKAIKEKDFHLLGKLFIESHLSMKNDYEVSLPEIDLLVNLCLQEKEVYGARLTGGGYGGCIVGITQKGQKEKIAEKVIKAYEKESHKKALLL